MIKFFELASADEKRRFSPYFWLVRMSLAHKELEVDCLPWHFQKKKKSVFLNMRKFLYWLMQKLLF